MLENLSKYWPLITVAAITIVSTFNIGYFSVIGLHFIGVMDLTNIIYSVGLVFGLLIVPIMMFPPRLLLHLQNLSSRPDAEYLIKRIMKIIALILGVSFVIGMFLPSYISIMTLFAVYYILAWLSFAGLAYVLWLPSKSVPFKFVFLLGITSLFTVYWAGGAVADREAFNSRTLYNVTTKDAEYDNVRLVRSSSNGFIIARDKQIIYLPAGELKSIVLISGP